MAPVKLPTVSTSDLITLRVFDSNQKKNTLGLLPRKILKVILIFASQLCTGGPLKF